MTLKQLENLKVGSIIKYVFPENGIGLSDFSDKKDYVVIGFYDSNDKVFKEKKESYYGLVLINDELQPIKIEKTIILYDFQSTEPSTDLSVDDLEQVTSWKRALNAARRTIGKKSIDKEPSDHWKAQAILAEHSPIRLVWYHWTWNNIKQWVSVHIIRHFIGCQKFVHSQRDDRRDNGVPRDELPQGSLNDMEMEANVQSLINISRKRVCNNAHPETRKAWIMVLDQIEKIDPILGEKLKLGRECVYRGFCPEFKCCGYVKTDQYQRDLEKYRNTDYSKK